MEITLTEALRIKNELSSIVKQLNYKINQSSFGETTEDGQVISEEKEDFRTVEEKLIKALDFSLEINDSISTFNRDNSVDNIIRKMQNAKLLLEVYVKNLDKTKAKKQQRFENLSTVRQKIEVVYTPSLTAASMKERISKQKENIRILQSQVEQLNQNKISLSFEYSDVESLID